MPSGGGLPVVESRGSMLHKKTRASLFILTTPAVGVCTFARLLFNKQQAFHFSQNSATRRDKNTQLNRHSNKSILSLIACLTMTSYFQNVTSLADTTSDHHIRQFLR